MKAFSLWLCLFYFSTAFAQQAILDEDFSDKRNPWLLNADCHIENGIYTLANSDQNYSVFFSTVPLAFDLRGTSYRVSTDVLLASQAEKKQSFGLVYGSSDFDNTNVFFVNPFAHTFNVTAVKGGQFDARINTEYLGGLMGNGKLHLELIKTPQFYFFKVNGQVVGRTPFYAPVGKNFGFMIPGTGQIEVDNFKVETVPGSEVAQLEKIPTMGRQVAHYYNENEFAMDYSWNPIKEEDAKTYCLYEIDEQGNIVDDVRLYDAKTDRLMEKYHAWSVSAINRFEDVLDGDHLYYDEFGDAVGKVVHRNPERLSGKDLLERKNDLVFRFGHGGRISGFIEYKNGKKYNEVEYFEDGKVKYAANQRDRYYFEGDMNGKVDKIYQERFTSPRVFDWHIRNDEVGVKDTSEGKYYMYSKIPGGVASSVEPDFDFNQSDWMISTTFTRVRGNQGIGIVWATSSDASTFEGFCISGNQHYYVNRIYNGVNISSMREWTRSDYIKEGNEPNNLTVLKMGNKLYFNINAHLVHTSDFIAAKSNNVALFVDKAENAAVYSELTIKQLDVPLPGYFGLTSYLPKSDGFTGNGSGFFVSENGYIATNYHVVDGSREVVVEVHRGKSTKSYKAVVVKVDKVNDLALLRISDPSFTALSRLPYTIKPALADVGSSVFTLGFPYALSLLGKEMKFTDGRISAQSGFQSDAKTYQISVPVQPGNSGGALFDTNGDVVGIVNAKFTAGDNVSYAIKATHLINLMRQIPAPGISLPSRNILAGQKLTSQIKNLEQFVVLIKIR